MPVPASLDGLRLAVPENVVLDGMDATVAAAFDRALSLLSAAGARIVRTRFAAFDAIAGGQCQRRLRGVRGLCLAPPLLAAAGDGYDPRIRVRIARGEHMSAADYLDLVAGARAADRGVRPARRRRSMRW